MSQEFVNVEINGVAVKAPKGEMIIRVTDAAGAYVPRFCYHDKLPIAANCRMCLVEVEKAPKPMPACATPVMEGMKIFTKSPKAIAAQKATMEFLLINHPLDCPICDQGGECELQDLAVGFGRDLSRYGEAKRVVKDLSLGPLISTDMTRCIHCTRCVRFGQDVAGIQELGTTGRGEHMLISTFVEHSIDHELSGNIIDLCPVGALNSKPARFSARAWEMTQHPLISPHDGFGSRLYGHVLRGQLMRVVPQPCEELNETWIADRDRFSYEGLYSDERLTVPRLRQSDGSLREVDWDTALSALATGLQAVRTAGLGLLAHPSSTLEECYLLSRIAAGLGSTNIDHRMRQRDFRDQESDQLAPNLGVDLAAVDGLNAILIVGAHLRAEMPLLAHRVRKAARRGARVSLINPAHFTHLFPVATSIETSAGGMVRELAGVLLAAMAAKRAGAAGAVAGAATDPAAGAFTAGVAISDAHRQIAASLLEGQRTIWLGALALRHSAYAPLRILARELARVSGATLGELAEGANGAGAYLAGCVPHRKPAGATRSAGLNARQMLEEGLPGYLLLGTEPWADGLVPQALTTLKRATFVGAISTFVSPQMLEVAHVLLPATGFAEGSGTFVNLEGHWQSFAGAARAPEAARPAWKILRVLGNLLDIANFDYQSSEQVRDELRAALAHAPSADQERTRGARDVTGAAMGNGAAGAASEASAAEAVCDVPMYQVDPLVRRAASLQLTQAGRTAPAEYAQ